MCIGGYTNGKRNKHKQRKARRLTHAPSFYPAHCIVLYYAFLVLRIYCTTHLSVSQYDSIPPSSPSIALFKDGELVHFVERHHIEGRTAEMIAGHLEQVFEEYC